jgi:hypothetical protein
MVFKDGQLVEGSHREGAVGKSILVRGPDRLVC